MRLYTIVDRCDKDFRKEFKSKKACGFSSAKEAMLAALKQHKVN